MQFGNLKILKFLKCGLSLITWHINREQFDKNNKNLFNKKKFVEYIKQDVREINSIPIFSAYKYAEPSPQKTACHIFNIANNLGYNVKFYNKMIRISTQNATFEHGRAWPRRMIRSEDNIKKTS